MRAQLIAQREDREADARVEAPTFSDQSRQVIAQRPQAVGLWLTAREAAAFVGNRSVKGFYEWRRRHCITCDGRGRVSRRDLEKALAVPRKPRAMSPNSLVNLRKARR